MLSRFREQLGTAGLIVAIVALVAALTGGAIAATSDSGQATASAKGKSKAKAKQGPRGKPGKPGPAGPAGPQGPAGAKGDNGAAGANGKDGTNGTNGTNGAPGTPGAAGKSALVTPFDSETEPAGNPCNEFGGVEVEVQDSGEPANVCNGETGFTDTLPAGKTETGTWSVVVDALEFAFNPVSFNIPLAAPPVGHIAPNSNCPGTVLEPKAAPGHFCLYKTDPAFPALEFVNPTNSEPSVSKYGVLLEMSGPAETFGWGTWAVTAPAAP